MDEARGSAQEGLNRRGRERPSKELKLTKPSMIVLRSLTPVLTRVAIQMKRMEPFSKTAYELAGDPRSARHTRVLQR